MAVPGTRTGAQKEKAEPLSFISPPPFDDGDPADLVILAKKIFTMIRDFIQVGSKDSIRDTAKAVLHLLPDLTSVSGPAAECQELRIMWSLVIHVAEQIPHNNPGMIRLVRLVDQLSRFPKTAGNFELVWTMIAEIDRDGCSDLFQLDNDQYPDSLHLLNCILKEHLKSPYDAYRWIGSPLQVYEWVNLNTFMAQLTSFNLLTSGLDFALWQLRYALEEEAEYSEDRDCRAATAAQWIIHSGQTMFRVILTSDGLSPGNNKEVIPGKLYNGEAGYSLHRWRFWKERLKGLRETGLFLEEWNVMIDKAIEYMEVLERAMIWGDTLIYWDK